MTNYKQTRDISGRVTSQYGQMLQNLSDDDDLKRRLRDVAEFEELRVAEEAADRIEELEAQLINAGSALEMCLDMLEALQKESGRSIEYGEEDAFRMGEWFEAYEFKYLELAHTTLAELKGEQK